MSTILACDTANGTCSVALWQNNRIISCHEELQSSKQAEQLLPLMEKTLADAHMTYKALDALAVTIGPGSFTGVRIGLAAMQGIRLVTGLPLIGITTLEAVASQANLDNKASLPIVVALDARRGQIYTQYFSPDLSPANEASLIDYHDIIHSIPDSSFLLIGDGTPFLIESLSTIHYSVSNSTALPHARDVAYVAAKQFDSINYRDADMPLYIRKPDAKKQDC